MAAKSPLVIHRQRKDDINQKLMEAILSEKVRMVKKFLSAGSNPNFCTASGDTMLILASKQGQSPQKFTIMGELLSKGADVNAYNNGGFTALLLAARRGDVDVIRFLIENRAKLTLEDSEGNSPLALAALGGHTEATRFLIDEYRVHGLDVDKKNMVGLTPLLLASQNGFIDTCKILVCHGNASVTIRDLDNFMTAEDWLRSTTMACNSELDFLTHARVRKKKGLKIRQKAKLLSDYVDKGTMPSPSSQNVYTFMHRNEKALEEPLSISLPEILHGRDSLSVTASSSVNSMFDVPDKSSVQRYKKNSTNSINAHELPVFSGKTNIFDAPCIAKRRVAPTKYSPNKQSCGLASGSLKPLKPEHTPKKKQDFNDRTVMELPQIHHKPLPPIKRISRTSEQ